MFLPRSVCLSLWLLATVGSTYLEENHMLCTTCSPPALEEEAAVDHASALISWLQSNGGFISDSIEIRRHDPNDSSSFMGIFASRDIAVNETVLQVPPSCYLQLEPGQIANTEVYHKDVPIERQMQVYFENACLLAHKLMNETTNWKERPESSHFGPYLAYLETQPTGMLPATYSEAGKALLRKLQGRSTNKTQSDNYDPDLVDWIQEYFIDTNCISPEPSQIHAVALVIQRGFDSELIPIWDMVNHDNGKQNIETNSLHSPEGIQAWASQPIRAGEELFSTYNYCTDCFDIGYAWGTPGIYRDFGFVETYPQNWSFLDHGIYFEVVPNDETGALEAVFFAEFETIGQLVGAPDDNGLKYLRTELARIDKLDLQPELDSTDLPPLEQYMIGTYHEHLRLALKAGIEATLQEHGDRQANEEL